MTESEWIKRIFEQAPVAIALLQGPDYRIKLANAAIYEIWQLPPGHPPVLGRPVFEAFPSIAGMGLEELLDQVRRTKQPLRGVRFPYKRHDQSIAYIDYVYAPIEDPTGQLDIVVLAIDVTQQMAANQQVREGQERYRQLAQQLTDRNRELEETNRQLSRSNDSLQAFAYVASHDLQEPLRKIQQFGDLLQTSLPDSTSEQALSYIDRMRTAASRMATLIRDLLAYSRIATQRTKDQPVSLDGVLSSVIEVLELVISEKKGQIEIDPLPTVAGDAVQLGQLFQNLISNALKFHQDGVAPRVHIRCQTVADWQLLSTVRPTKNCPFYYRIDVSDNGIGFDERYRDRIFQVFQRLHGRSAYAGTGIGLAICERVVSSHGGAITAISQPGQGATFIIYLPAPGLTGPGSNL
ncbi:sensor histidine kinase [Spirosoma sp.]|uniref:sensor histidine kinase n=1 Tax=Spirosoma sp. TaxID=1899569 RepID=UPI003B3B188F